MQKRNQNHAPILEVTGRKPSKATVARLLSSTSILAAKGLVAAALLALPVQLDLSGGDQIVTIGKAHAESGSGSGGSGSGGDNSGSGSGGSGGGDDNSGSGSGGGGDNSGPGSGGGNDNDSDNDGDNSGPGSGGDNDNNGDNSGPGRGGDNDDGDRDDNDDRDDGADDDGNNNAARPEVVVDLSQSDLTAVLNGSKILVDNLGRVLEVEIELERGGTTVIAKPHGGDAQRNPGPIGSFTIVTR